ncbi:hypothetical protein CBM2599_B50988 [Cupriavidus taiwanensis]|uniref:hypothetical protein n=1 Tax=Cupriavidus taiwanensis TaxID=164546 RepID=UPI000E1735FC|nr:hypothetical protein [Cupriavidus taiwanensis]SOY92474.1 hypothetical protein CBM2600_B10003 [Cupriavidus taiwanensis]SOY97242.1 hypothetical protein CBM2599_B50988 [Cupriavidus taiwanensis]
MDRISLTIQISRFFERKLKDLGATGHGLHQKTRSIRRTLPPTVGAALTVIAARRNHEVHEGTGDWDELLFLNKALGLAFELGKCSRDIDANAGGNPALDALKLASKPVVIVKAPDEKEAMSDEAIADYLLLKQPILTESELEDHVDRANAEAMAVYHPVSERWDAFLYLAREKSKDDTERLHNLTLALLTGADARSVAILARSILTTDTLANGNKSFEVSSTGGDTGVQPPEQA